MTVEGAPPAEQPPLRSRGGAVLIGALAIDSIGNGLFLPLGLVFFTHTTSVSLAFIGVLLSVANIIQLPVPLFVGALADRFGALPLVVLAQVLQAFGYGAASFVTGPAGILCSALLTALGVRLFWSAIFTLVSDYVDGRDNSRSKDYWYGWSNISRTAGMGLGGVLTGIVIADPGTGANSFRAIALVAAVCFMIAAVTIATAVRAPRAKQQDVAVLQGYRELLRNRPYLGLIGVNTVFALSTMMLALALPTVVLLHLHAPGWLVSGLLVGNTIVVSLATASVVLQLQPFRRTRAVAGAALLWAFWCSVMALLRPEQLGWTIPALIFATLLYAAATAVHAPISMGLAAAAAPADTRGRYLAVFQYSFTLAEIVGPSFFTTLFALQHSLPWIALAALNLLAAAALLKIERRMPSTALYSSEHTQNRAAEPV